MIVPRFWAEGRVQHRDGQRQVTIRRFGWSDLDEADAQVMADRRAQEALARFLSGEKLPRRDPKVPYNGAEGVPIREEIISRHGESIVTRNTYGALCLNSPDTLFADVDHHDRPEVRMKMGVMLLVVLIAIVVGILTQSRNIGLVVGALGMVVGSLLMTRREEKSMPPEGRALQRLEAFLGDHPDWRVRVYRTPAGLRLMALHRAFDPHEPAVIGFFEAMDCDPVYVRMCLNQNCFRARVSPKPWRVGIDSTPRPRPGVWPVKPEHLAGRARWVAEYNAAAAGYSACEFMGDYGRGVSDPAIEAVRDLHDDLARALSGLPTA